MLRCTMTKQRAETFVMDRLLSKIVIQDVAEDLALSASPKNPKLMRRLHQ